MFRKEMPVFKRGRVLKLEMLESIRDYPRHLMDIFHFNYSDGILCGCEPRVLEQHILLSKGILKHRDKLYLLEEEEKIQYTPTEKTNLLKIKFLPVHKEDDFITYDTKLFLDENVEVQQDEMEICRFKLKKGAILRHQYVDFKDLATEYDTLNIINAPYSAPRKSTLNPYITGFFAKDASKYSTLNPYDIAFCMSCLDSEGISKEKLLFYITNRLGVPKKDYSNLKLYGYLCDILDQIKRGDNKVITGRKMNRARTIIVD